MGYKRKTFEFSGDTPPPEAKLPAFPSSIVLVGYLEEFLCETPEKESVNILKDTFLGKPILKNTSKGRGRRNPTKKPLVCASSDGRFGIIISPDVIVDTVPESRASGADGFTDAVELHTDFHGVSPKEIKRIDAQPFRHVEFFGWLNHIIYSVPQYSERRGVPFIHEAKDRGDDLPKAENKPFICLSPNRDLLLMYGEEMCFSDRGFIG